jgi:hypothetical protein
MAAIMSNSCLVVKPIRGILHSRSGRPWRKIFEQGNLGGERQRDLACSSIIELRTAASLLFSSANRFLLAGFPHVGKK